MRCLFLLLVVSSVLAQAEERPNLLFILTDDQRDNSFSGMGHEWVKTPHIDELLTQSVRFENAYIAEPTCRPSRAAILMGNHERVNRIGFSSRHRMTRSQWDESYPELLREGGFRTGYVGKWHAGRPEGVEFQDMFDFWAGHDGHGPFYFKDQDKDGNVKTVTTNRRHTDSAIRFLRSEHGDKPFCLSLSYATPHGSKVRSMAKDTSVSASLDPRLKDHPIYGGMYRDLDISYPMQDKMDPYDFIPKRVMDQTARAKNYYYIYDPVSSKEHHYRYYQMITEIDQMVGELVAELKKLKLDRKTVIVFASDHGLLMGEYGMGGKGLLYDLSVKFPCFVFDPGAPEKQAGTSSKAIVSSLDIAVSLLDYAGLEPGPFMTGRSIKPLVRGEKMDHAWREGLFLENMYVGRDTPFQEGYVEEGWKYIRYYKKKGGMSSEEIGKHSGEPLYEMLFSLGEDPEEVDNLAGNPEYASRLKGMRQKTDDGLAEVLEIRRKYAAKNGITN